jgi:molybdate transport system substrate-binding protein
VVGRLALWSPDPDLVDGEGRVLDEAGSRRLALANPLLAPYGRAAREALTALGVESVWATRTVTGENVAQVLHFVDSGNADLGLVALSQLIDRGGSRWIVPDSLHAPIVQHLVVLSDRPAARAFAAYVVSAPVRPLLEARGYQAPGDRP